MNHWLWVVSTITINMYVFFVKQRKAGELDDEILQFTSQVLNENPDIYTLWNIRKEAIILIKEKT